MDVGRQGRQAVVAGARLALGQWADHLGTDGMLAMRALPWLVARVDQHTARIRDVIADGDGRVHPVMLAAYADGVADAATARGWSVREVRSHGWQAASWPSIHLLAVCVLATGRA